MKPILLTADEVADILTDIQQGLRSGDTDEGSIQFAHPTDETLHGKEWVALAPVERAKWESFTRPAEGDGPPVTMYRPKLGYLFVRASYRTGRTMGQGGLRMIGVM